MSEEEGTRAGSTGVVFLEDFEAPLPGAGGADLATGTALGEGAGLVALEAGALEFGAGFVAGAVFLGGAFLTGGAGFLAGAGFLGGANFFGGAGFLAGVAFFPGTGLAGLDGALGAGLEGAAFLAGAGFFAGTAFLGDFGLVAARDGFLEEVGLVFNLQSFTILQP
jgi:hypothetical protein